MLSNSHSLIFLIIYMVCFLQRNIEYDFDKLNKKLDFDNIFIYPE